MKSKLVALALAGFTLVVVAPGCSAEVDPEAEDPGPASSEESSEALSGGDVACTLSSIASTGALVGSVACWVGAAYTGGTASPICVWLSSAGVTAAKVANGAAQCATGCGLTGAVCKDISRTFGGANIPTTARVVNAGCTKGGWYAAERDVCGMALNRFYARDAPESRQCVPGKATGFWALSDQDKSYIRNPANCSARGFGK
jgi:hypothetical protein